MIELRHVSKSFAGAWAAEDITFEHASARSLAILGPSGSGKTTLLRLIAGLEIPDRGQIFLAGALASRPGWVLEPHRRGIGFVFQSPALFPHMTVAQNILFGLNGTPRAEARRRVEELLDQVSLTGFESRYPSQLSGGEARRAALARTLAPRPRILLMDEPLTNLDDELKQQLIPIIRNAVRDQGASLIYVTHDADEARQIADQTVRLKNGRLEMD